MRGTTLALGLTLGLLLPACERPAPIELEVPDCVWDIYRGCAGEPDPTPIVLWVAIRTTGADPTWVGPEVLIGDADKFDTGAAPEVSTRMALNAEVGFRQSRLGLGPHYVLIRDLPARCESQSPNPQFVTLEEGTEKRAEFEVRCS